MEKSIVELLRAEFPDLDEFLGELWLAWPDIDSRRRQYRSSAARWECLVREARKVRRAVHNEGRPSRTIYMENMDDLPAPEAND